MTFYWLTLHLSYALVLCMSFPVCTIRAAQEFFCVNAAPHKPGLFSALHTIVGILDEYDKSNAIGISIDFGKEGWYYEPSHGPNWWNYYFEPITMPIPPDATIRSFSEGEQAGLGLRAQTLMPLYRAKELLDRYVQLKPHVNARVQAFYERYFWGCYVIGVHYRGTDKGCEVPLVKYKDAVKIIKRAISNYPGNTKNVRVFLATDDQCFFNLLRKKLKKRLVWIDTVRLDKPVGTHTSNIGSPYQKGEDALVDCILLSLCDLLIKTGSNLSDFARKFNPNIPVIHLSRSPGDCNP